ncbi:hypothetical protein [Maridesulfovibrio bastinii]|uniref:hypothetical protein n=1 Tax=Maridesulfovibrio bastinii TaxID=47157 RepID=UPI0004863C8C|nr:hypothetical protein [Maridesulfovibrio bastinii]
MVMLIFILFPLSAHASEHDYQKLWCYEHSGVMEYRLPDSTRVDCLTSTHAVEMDFGRKWAEAIGQSLYYSLRTGKRAGIVLILDGKKELRFLKRLKATIKYQSLPIDVWIMDR